MIFGRKRAKDVEDVTVGEEESATLTGEDLIDEPIAEEDSFEDDDVDWRADGPFDLDEVDLDADDVERLDLGALILTPWDGLGLQLQVNEANQQVTSALAFWEETALQLTLLAAPTSGGLAADAREDLTLEAEQAGGSAALAQGPFGAELRRVLPVEGPNGEQLFQESRTWFVEGPRWMLTGTLLGRAARLGEEASAEPFVEFFRNVVVRRGERPMVPGEVIPMTLPKGVGPRA